MRLLGISIFISLFFEYIAHGESVIPPESIAELKSIYRESSDIFGKSQGKDGRAFEQGKIEFELEQEGADPARYMIYSALNVQTWIEPLKWIGTLDCRLYSDLKKSERETVPKLAIQEVLKKALSYLSEFKVQLNNDNKLTALKFNGAYPSCWEIRWTRSTNGYPWDDFNPNELESVYVIFHEKLGLVAIGNNIHTPSPRSFAVKFSRETVIEKAAKYVPLVQRTPFYLQARKAGFTANGVESCELKVAVPNWLLDPARAIWIRDKPPEETRLCWVVRFTTVDSIADERGLRDKNGKPLKLIAPDILIYVDAATGEVVGANFT